MSKIKYISLHHSGGIQSNKYLSTAHQTLEDIDNAHRVRWAQYADEWPAYKSELGFHAGYNFIITKDGSWKQTRKINEETAAQKGHNFDTISFLVIGNFLVNPATKQMVDTPTEAQVRTLKLLLRDIFEGNFEDKDIKVKEGAELDLSLSRIYPHRWYNFTECNGALPDNWGSLIMVELFVERFESMKTLMRFSFEKYILIKKLLTSRPSSSEFGSAGEDMMRG